jgi:hypothetical protein
MPKSDFEPNYRIEMDEERLLHEMYMLGRDAILPELTEKIQTLEGGFAAGDRSAILEAVRLAMLFGEPVPEWAREPFLEAVDRGSHGHLKSWDEAFGRPNTPGRVKRFWRDLTAMLRIKHKIDASTESHTDELFSRVGKEEGVCATRVKELYGMPDPNFRKARLRR